MSTQLLRAPGPNRTPRRVVAHTPGMVCLDTTCVTPACRWYTLADMVAANDRATVAAALKAPVTERHTVKAVDMGIYFTVEQNSWDAALRREWNRREVDNYFAEEDSKAYWIFQQNRVERGFYKRDIEEQIAAAVKYPEPLKLVSFEVYPQAAWLGIANGLLELKRQAIEMQVAVSDAVADGQLPRAA